MWRMGHWSWAAQKVYLWGTLPLGVCFAVLFDIYLFSLKVLVAPYPLSDAGLDGKLAFGLLLASFQIFVSFIHLNGQLQTEDFQMNAVCYLIHSLLIRTGAYLHFLRILHQTQWFFLLSISPLFRGCSSSNFSKADLPTELDFSCLVCIELQMIAQH